MRQRIRRVRRVRRVRRRRPEKNARFFPKTGKKNPAENKNLPVSLCLVVRVPADVLVARVFFGYIDPV
jgi:hypothetical protein